jgi:hypothetical protein
LTAADVYVSVGGRAIPLTIVVLVFIGGLAFFSRDGRYFAERV